MIRDSFLEGGTGLIQRIENRVSGIPTLLEHARDDQKAAQQLVGDTGQRLGQPFRYAQTLADAEDDLARVETQLTAIRDGASQTPSDSQEQEPPSVDQVREFRATMGVNPGSLQGKDSASLMQPPIQVNAERPGLGM
jgi:hypothetical protein